MAAGKLKKKDILDDLSKEQLRELKKILKEDAKKDTHSLSDFQKATSRWRVK
jgi:hypothetical protein